MPIFIFLHVLTMFIAVAMAYGPAMMIVVAGDNVSTLRGVMAANNRLARLVAPVFGVGVALGFVAVFVHNFDPLRPWLLIAYVLVVASLVMTFVFTNPWLGSVTAAVESSSEDAPSVELQALLNSPRNRALLGLDALIIVALIADMVLKPFGP
jgi:hypothetical protein